MASRIDLGFSLRDLISDLPPIVIVDIGAMPIDEEEDFYAPLMKPGCAELIGFEPNTEACRKLNETLEPPHQCLPFAIGDGKKADFHIAAHPISNSLLKPNIPLVSKYQGLLEAMELQSIQSVQTHRLDEVVNKDEIDFLKLDVQGAELAVLQGAKRLAPTALVIHTEVEFVPLYVDQPLFADVDAHLRSIGFQFHSFPGFGTRDYVPGPPVEFCKHRLQTWLWSEAIYVPDVMRLDSYDDNKLFKLATILHDVYGSIDFTAYILTLLENRGRVGLVDAYQAKLMA